MALGGNGDLGGARSFVRRHGLKAARPLFDARGSSWSALGAAYQPWAVLVGTDGAIIKSFPGEFSSSDVLAALPRPSAGATGLPTRP